MNVLKKFFLWLGIAGFLIVSGGVGFGIYYGDEVKALVIAEINQSLVTRVDVKGVDFSFFKKFPYASVNFSGITIFDSQDGKLGTDTLLLAGNIFLCFNIFDIVNQRYHLQKIEFSNAFLKPYVDGKNKKNYIIWKEKENDENQKFQFALDEIVLKNVGLFYVNDYTRDMIIFRTHTFKLTGNFSSEKYDLKGNGSMYSELLQFDRINYIKKQPVRLFFGVHIDNEKRTFTFDQSSVAISDINLEIKGNISIPEQQNPYIDLQIKGSEIKLEQLLSLLPAQFTKDLKNYSSEGVFQFSGEIKGAVSDKIRPTVNADFGISKGTLLHKESATKISNISLKGKFSTGKNASAASTILEVSEFSCNPGIGAVSGNFMLKDFTHPHLSAAIKSEFDLKELSDFFKTDTIEAVNGRLLANLSIDLVLHPDSGWSAKDFRNTRSSGKLVLENADLKFKESTHHYHNLSGEMSFDNNDILVKSVSGGLNSSDFSLSGTFRNIFPWLFDEQEKLLVEANFTSTKLMLDEMLTSSQSTATDTVYGLHFSNRININLVSNVAYLKFRRFEASNISGRVSIKNNVFAASDLFFNALNGEVSANGKIEAGADNNFKIICRAAIAGINVNKLFYQFEDFGQTTLCEKHINGTASAGIEFDMQMDKQLNINQKSLYSKATVLIENGELNNFEPMKKLSSYIRVPDLNEIKFAALNNTIEIKDETIIIPKMEINSSAIDISFGGTHSFNDEIDYRFRLLLRDILARKAKDNNKNNSEFGYVEDDDEKRRMSVFIAMKGTMNNPKFSYDGMGLKEKMATDIKQEKQSVKALLKEEFGIYKSDSTLKLTPVNKPVKHQVEWEENDQNNSSDKKTKEAEKEKTRPSLTPQEQKEKKKVGKWLDKVAGDPLKQEYE
jgi:hypothetical protein